MKFSEVYLMYPGKTVLALESLAEMCIKPDQRPRFTVLGYTNGAPQNNEKCLVPFKPNSIDDYSPYVRGPLGPYFRALLEGASATLERSQIQVRSRVDIRNLLLDSAGNYAQVDNLLKKYYGLPSRGDDLLWRFNLDFRSVDADDNTLKLSVTDNGDVKQITPGFSDFCQNTFSSVINPFAARKIHNLASN